MNALVINCSPVKNGATAEMFRCVQGGCGEKEKRNNGVLRENRAEKEGRY